MKIEFLGYDGEYPNLCRGQLVLRIDGEIHAFGQPCWYLSSDYKAPYEIEDKNLHESFWTSGGSAGVEDDGEEYCFGGDWEFIEDYLPEFLQPHAKEIFELFQANVPNGCCGGCI